MNPIKSATAALKGIAWATLFLLFSTSCSLSRGADPALVSFLQTQVALSVDATQVAQALLPTQTQTVESSPTPTTTSTEVPTATLLPTLTPSPTFTETPTDTPTSTPPNANAFYVPEDAIFFYLTSLGTGGSVGCGDSLVKLTTGSSRSGDTAADLKIALDAIFIAGQYVGGLYNATYPSALRVGDVILKADGTAVVNLNGTYEKPADHCDASRFRAQVWTTALQFKEITRFEPHVGNSLLGDRLALYSDSGK